MSPSSCLSFKVLLQEALTQKISIDESEKIESYLKLADEYHKNGLKSQALEYSQKVINIDSENANAWFIYADCVDDISEKKMALIKAKAFAVDTQLVDDIQSALDSISDVADVLIDFSGVPMRDAIVSLLHVSIDSMAVPVNINSVTRIPMKKGHHRIEVYTNMNAVGKASASFDLQNSVKISVGCQTKFVKMKFTLNVTEI